VSAICGTGTRRAIHSFEKKPTPRLIVSLLFVLLAYATTAQAQSYRAEAFRSSPPEELSLAIRETLTNEGVRVVGPSGILCELWLRKAIPIRLEENKELGVSFGQIAEGTLVGAVRFPAGVVDFRRGRVKPGVYTLRFALNPVDGNHQGVAPQRDFLLLGPAQMDTNPANVPREEMYALSRKARGATHPSVWSMGAAHEPPAKLPAMQHHEGEDHRVLLFRAQLQPEQGAGKHVVFALVVVGYAPES